MARIVARKRADSEHATVLRPELERRAEQTRAGRRGFRAALLRRSPAVIAEIKKASPSKGVLCRNFDPAGLAREYERGGAAALSVLTDEPFFQGSLKHLALAREAVSLPVLRKDFTLDEYHVVEAGANGADAVLLIAAILEEREIRTLRALALQYGMAAVVEVHSQREVRAAVEAGADIIGVNNRDLKTFQVSLETSLRLAEEIPENVLKISESGIQSPDDIRRLADAGFNGFLVGESLLTSASPAAALRRLIAQP
ncbi:MAG TPA: indole-3-glycerol phosphate synthase TrpC [Bryobacteraceae bacterium]|nr:indole-3-glycerol phosphate synthase TrpC [Bryobacteraceae bacterium]